MHFSQAALVASSTAEVSGQEGLDQFSGERRTDHLPTQTEDIHVVIFNALMGGKNIVDEPGPHPWNFVRGDGRSYAAAAERYSAFSLTRRHGAGHGDNEIGIVICGVQSVCAEVHNLVP